MKQYDRKFMDLESAGRALIDFLKAQPSESWVSIPSIRAMTNWPTRNGPGLVELNAALMHLVRRRVVEFKDGWDVKANLPARVRLVTTPAAPATENP